MRSPRSIFDFLRREGLVTNRAAVEGDLEIVEARSRNTSYHIVRSDGPCYLLKQGPWDGSPSTIADEAAVYSFLWSECRAAPLRPYLPAFYGYRGKGGGGGGAQLLVLELYPDAETLLDYHTRTGRFPISLAEQMASVLSALHNSELAGKAQATLPAGKKADARQAPSSSGLRATKPWVLSIPHPGLEMLRDMSAANAHYISIIQQNAPFEQLLDDLSEGWKASRLVHGDIKWANCLLVGGDARRQSAQLKVVDWEFAGWGDPLWDVGSVFADYLHCWLFSIPLSTQADPTGPEALARYPLKRMQPAMQLFWESYREACGLGAAAGDTTSRWLTRSIRYAAARLVQLGFEQNQHTSRLSSNAVLLLQLALNMLQRPDDAMEQLVGLSKSSPQPAQPADQERVAARVGAIRRAAKALPDTEHDESDRRDSNE